jgi:hypothetical protein
MQTKHQLDDQQAGWFVLHTVAGSNLDKHNDQVQEGGWLVPH